jgi:hypothetical protein
VARSPVKKLAHGAAVGLPRIFIANLGGKEFDDAPGGFVAGVLKDGR